jgi:hypothetical protein
MSAARRRARSFISKGDEVKMDKQLFEISTKIANLHGYKDVVVDWFVEHRAQCLFGPNGSLGVAYADVITDYEHAYDKHYAEGAVEEYFTEDEANAFVAWLKANRNGSENTTVEAKSLPIPNNIMGLGATPFGGGPSLLTTGEADDYDLPFKVAGHYDTRFYEFDETLPHAQRSLRGVQICEGQIKPWYLGDDDSVFPIKPVDDDTDGLPF